MSSIALVFPKSTFLESALVFPPLGVFYIASRLESLGHEVEFFDLNVDDFPEDVYDEIWVSATSPQMAEIKRLGNIVKDYDAKSILGGASAWADPSSCMNLGYDLVVGGEADEPNNIQKILSTEKGYLLCPVSKTLDWVLPPSRKWTWKYHAELKDFQGNSVNATSMFNTRGCPLTCSFCIAEGQRVLMAGGDYKNIEDVKIGDMVMGMHKGKTSGFYIAPTKVTNTMIRGEKETIQILAGDSVLNCTPDHKIYVNDGHKTRWKRADSSIVGKTSVRLFPEIHERSVDFKKGWLAGYLAGDGCVHIRNNKTQVTITSRDVEMLDVIQEWGAELGFNLRRFKHNMGKTIFPTKLDPKYIDGVQITSGVEADDFVKEISSRKDEFEYACGWLAGMYDSDGSLDGQACKIFQSVAVKPYNCQKIEGFLEKINISYYVDEYKKGMNRYIMNSSIFLPICRPMMQRKYPSQYYYKSLPRYEIKEVRKSGLKRVFDLTTECHSFIAEGFIVHNCESGRHGVIWSELTRYEPLEVVEFQLAQCQMLGYSGIYFYDDVKPLNKRRMLQELELYKKYGIVWRCFLRSDIINNHGGKEYLEQMRDAGLVEIFLGVESADNDVKNAIHKKTSIEQDTNVVRWCKELGIRSKTSFILGLPSESRESIEKTRRWILENRPDRVQVGRMIPFKGTPLTKHPEQYDLTYEQQPPDEWFYMGYNDFNKSFVSTSKISREEIDELWHSLNDELKREGIPS